MKEISEELMHVQSTYQTPRVSQYQQNQQFLSESIKMNGSLIDLVRDVVYILTNKTQELVGKNKHKIDEQYKKAVKIYECIVYVVGDIMSLL